MLLALICSVIPVSIILYFVYSDQSNNNRCCTSSPEKDKLVAETITRINDCAERYFQEKLKDNHLNFDTTKNVLIKDNKYSFVEDAHDLLIRANKYLLVDDTSKVFAIANFEYVISLLRYIRNNIKPTCKQVKLGLKNYLDVLSSNEIQSLNIEEVTSQNCHLNLDKFQYKDLIKVDIIDKTNISTQKTYTMQSKMGDSILGACVGDLLLGPLNGASAGAIIGSSGKREIVENTKTTKRILFQVVLYLNSLDMPNITLDIHSESELREVTSVLEYILNNKNN